MEVVRLNPQDRPIKVSALVHVLGRNLQMPAWAQVMLAAATGALGELGMALLVACVFGVRVLVIGTGASGLDARTRANWSGDWCLPDLPDGTSEAEFTAEVLARNWPMLAALPALSPWQTELEALRTELRIYCDVSSRNTEQEIAFSAESVTTNRRLFIGPPSHIARASVLAAVLRENGLFQPGEVVSWIPSQVCFPGSTPRDISVIEPVHLEGHVVPNELVHLLGKLVVAAMLAKPGPGFYKGLAEWLLPYAERLHVDDLRIRGKPVTAECLETAVRDARALLSSMD